MAFFCNLIKSSLLPISFLKLTLDSPENAGVIPKSVLSVKKKDYFTVAIENWLSLSLSFPFHKLSFVLRSSSSHRSVPAFSFLDGFEFL